MTRQQRLVRTSGGLNPRKAHDPQVSRHRYWFFIHYLAEGQREPGQQAQNRNTDTEIGESTKIRRLEAALFLAREGLSSRKLAKIAGLADATEARTLIRRLNETYERQGRAFKVEELAGGYTLLTRARFASWLRRMAHIPGEKKLSQPAMETLSIVGYRQPVLRADVEAIRGVGCSEVLKQLMELDLVRISGRSDDLGRPYLYGTTRRFLQLFGLRSADRLPRKAWVNESQLALVSTELEGLDSEAKESTVTNSLNATAVLEEELVADKCLPLQQTLVASSDSDEFYEDEEFDNEEGDDEEGDIDEEGEDEDSEEKYDTDEGKANEDSEEEFDDEDDWDDEETADDDESDEEDLEEEDDLDDEEDDLEDENEWQEVSDDDDGWEDDDDDDDDDEEDEEWEEENQVDWD